LINPAMNLKKLGRFSGLLEPMPCTGLAYIAGSLEAHGCHVRAIDMFAEKLSAQEVVDKTRRFRPDLVGMTVLTPSAPVCAELSKMLYRAIPGLRVVWGGIHADIFAKDILRAGEADFAVHHDGEITVCELVDALAANETDFSEIDGLSWKPDDGGEPVTNRARDLNRDLDSLPYPAWHLFPYHRYGLLPFADFAKPVLTMVGSRGCPYRCDYCSLINTGGKVFRRRDPIRIVDEYEFLVDRFGVKQIGFVDPIFPLVKKDLEPFCNELIARGLHERCHWLSETRADRLDPDTCERIYAAGCRRILMGIESGSDLLLGNVNKNTTTSKVREGVKNLHAAGLQSVGLFMIGMPGETPDTTRQTVEFAVDLDLDFAKFAITVPFPGSKLFEDRWQKTLFRDDWENYTTFNPDPELLIYSPPGYDPNQLVRMQSWAHQRFYLRPRQIRKQLWDLRTVSPKMLLYGIYGMAM
jgi:radical SAM superfamily enzyme YgiQ (UPF0313 family)